VARAKATSIGKSRPWSSRSRLADFIAVFGCAVFVDTHALRKITVFPAVANAGDLLNLQRGDRQADWLVDGVGRRCTNAKQGSCNKSGGDLKFHQWSPAIPCPVGTLRV
jgi:hypothetical protein